MLRLKSLAAALWLSLSSLLLVAHPCQADFLGDLEQYWKAGIAFAPGSLTVGHLHRELLAKAQPDECYVGIGDPGNTYPGTFPCAHGEPKVNQAYVWGLTKTGDDLWLGTLANTHCLVISGFLGVDAAHENASWVCEFGQNKTFHSDWRPPRVFVYNTASRALTERTPLTGAGGALMRATTGLRAAGTIADIVFLAGPGLAGGLNMFAFSAQTGGLLQAFHFNEYNNVRHFLNVNGVLYCAVGKTGGGGGVLRWVGSSGTPLIFESVADLDSDGADLAFHEGRLFVSTWPNVSGGAPPALAGLYMSPVVPSGGLHNSDAGKWTKVWQADSYEPDSLVAATYGGGGLASHQGYLYWGTMHVPFVATTIAAEALDLDANGNGKLDTDELLGAALGTHRAISIFRGKGFATRPKIQLLYGERYLPVYDPASKRYTTGRDAAHQNRVADPRPKWGHSGLGNFFNAYTWTMATYDKKLYIGTFDWSYLLAQGLAGMFMEELVSQGKLRPGDAEMIQNYLVRFHGQRYGADLFKVVSSVVSALPESLGGVGNYTNYGVRTMFSDATGLYLGMANPMNLLTDPDDNLPEGGWELIRLYK